MMKKVFERNRRGALFSFALAASLLLLSNTGARAQAAGNNAAADAAQEAAGERGGNLAVQLRLTPEQVSRIASIREQTKEERRVVNMRVREAQRALEEAIYADDASEALVEQRARELSAAQAEALRLRSRTEWEVRRVLTPEQLTALRSMRARARARLQEQRLLNPNRGPQRPLRRQLERRANALNGQDAAGNNSNGNSGPATEAGAKPADGSMKQGVGPRAGKRRAMFQRRPRL